MAAGSAHRRAQRPPLPADRVRSADHLLRRSAPGAVVPARSAPELVLCRAAHLGEAEGGPRDDDRGPARAAASGHRGGSRRRRAQGAARAARRGIPAELAQEVARADAEIFSGLARCWASTRSRRSTSAPARRRSRCSSSSTRWPAAGRAVGDERDVAPARQPAGQDQTRHGRATRPARRSSSTSTARC